MAAGDVKSDLQNVSTGTFLAIQPPAGEEWVIHNVHHEGEAELYFYDGTRTVRAFSDAEQGVWPSLFLHCTNTRYYRIKNTNASTKALGYDGIQSK